jgi:hypothetical protein
LCRNIDDIENAIDEANEQTENMRQIQEALATPVGASADFDEVLILSYYLVKKGCMGSARKQDQVCDDTNS